MTTKDKLIDAIDNLSEEKLSELLKVANGFRKKTVSGKKNRWAEFAGILTDEEARIMKAAIEEEFEQIEDEPKRSRT